MNSDSTCIPTGGGRIWFDEHVAKIVKDAYDNDNLEEWNDWYSGNSIGYERLQKTFLIHDYNPVDKDDG